MQHAQHMRAHTQQRHNPTPQSSHTLSTSPTHHTLPVGSLFSSTHLLIDPRTITAHTHTQTHTHTHTHTTGDGGSRHFCACLSFLSLAHTPHPRHKHTHTHTLKHTPHSRHPRPCPFSLPTTESRQQQRNKKIKKNTGDVRSLLIDPRGNHGNKGVIKNGRPHHMPVVASESRDGVCTKALMTKKGKRKKRKGKGKNTVGISGVPVCKRCVWY
jgi:hypothetical protein